MTKGSGRFVPTPCYSEAVYGRVDARNQVCLMIILIVVLTTITIIIMIVILNVVILA